MNKHTFVTMITEMIVSVLFAVWSFQSVLGSRKRYQDQRLIVVEKFENCEGTYPFQFLPYSTHRNGSFVLLNGKEIASKDFSKEVSISVRVDKCMDKSNPDTCEYYVTWKWNDMCVPYKILPFMKSYIEAHEPKLGCPVKKGNYTIKNAKIDAETLTPFLPTVGGSRVMWKFLIQAVEFGRTSVACLSYHIRIAHVKALI